MLIAALMGGGRTGKVVSANDDKCSLLIAPQGRITSL